MKIRDFFKDMLPVVLLNLTCALFLFMYLMAIGMGRDEILLVLISWFLILSGYFSIQFWVKKKRIDDINRTMDSLDQKYLFAEIVEINGNAEQQVYFSHMKRGFRSMIE